jgi:NAD(P)-dependent dehydrogenase (short-subunit alcohol dehydrogenase family)
MNAETPSTRILVTGGTSGIGFAAARRLAQSGPVHLVINGRDGERGDAARRRLAETVPTATIHFVAADVSSQAGATGLFEQVTALLGGLDVLVNSAGGDFAPALFHDASMDDLDGILRHWLLSTMYCCRLALPLMTEGGAIVNVASDAAKVPTPGEAAIGAAMAGITMFSRTLALEAKRRKIRVNVVTPSLVRNTLSHDRITAGGFSAKLFAKAIQAAHLGVPEPEDVAAVIAFLAGPETKRVTGQVVSINGGISAG